MKSTTHLDAARAAIALTPKLRRLGVAALANLHSQMGSDRFALRFGLRAPQSSFDVLTLAFYEGKVTEDQFRQSTEALATRPVDHEMLNAYFRAVESRLRLFADFLALVIELATNQQDPGQWRHREHEVDEIVARMDSKYTLFSTEIQTAFEFIEQSQSDRTDPVTCADFASTTAHGLAEKAFSHIIKFWKSTKATAERSRTDPRYLYSTHACALVYETWIEKGLSPRPDDLSAIMCLEREKIRNALTAQLKSQTVLARARTFLEDHPLVVIPTLIVGVIGTVVAGLELLGL